MPGKLTEVKPGTGALGLLASAYSNSDEEYEEDEILESKQGVQNNAGQTIPTVPMGAAIIPISSGEVSEVKSERPDSLELKNGKDEHEPMNSEEEVEILESSHLQKSIPITTYQELEQSVVGTDQSEMDGTSSNSAGKTNYDKHQFKAAQKSKESESSDSESDSDSDCSDDSDSSDDSRKGKRRNPPRVKGELLISDLPPIEDLHISVPHEQCQAIGIVKSVIAVDSLVVVESYPNSAALNLDTVLFLDEGDRTLGRIFDVFGPVKQPHYSVRFNSNDHISTRGIQIGMVVYCAPKTEHTSYVFLAQLRLLRGTDASWEDDIEPPPEEVDFSDDEAERGARRGGNQNDSIDPDTGNRIKATPRRGRGRGRGRKRNFREDGSRINPELQSGGNTGTTELMKSSYNPPYVSGFYPPSMRFRGPGHWNYGQGYGSGQPFHSMSSPSTRPYYGHPRPSMYESSHNPRAPGPIHNRSSFTDPRVSYGYYNPPRPLLRATQQPFSNGHNRNPIESSRVPFRNYGPPPPPPPPQVSQLFPHRYSNGSGRIFSERSK